MSSDRNVAGILNELERIVPERDKHNLVEARASHVISATINLMSMIRENFSEEEADDLTKRLLLAIRNEEPEKFSRKVRKLKEEKEKSVKKQATKRRKSQ